MRILRRSKSGPKGPDLVIRAIKNVVEGHSELDDSKRCPQVACMTTDKCHALRLLVGVMD